MRAVLPSRSRAPRLIPVRPRLARARTAAVRGAGAARELLCLARRFPTRCTYGLAKVFWSVRAARPRWLPSPRAALQRPPYAEPAPSGTFAAAGPAALVGPAGTASRSGASGSVTVPDSSSKSPCASLVTAAGTGGARSATARRPDRTSSGRTAGVTCRTTSRSIAQGPSPAYQAGRAAPVPVPVTSRDGLQADHGRPGRRRSADRSSYGVRPRPDSAARKADTACSASCGVDAVQPQLPHGSGQPVGEPRRTGLDGVDDVEAGRQRLVEQLTQLVGVAVLRQGDLQVLGLAARAGGCGIGVRHLRVRGEPRRVRHGHLGTPQRPLEGALEVAVAGEPEAAALGVAQSDALHRRCGRRAFGLSLAQWFFSSVRDGRGERAALGRAGCSPDARPAHPCFCERDLGCGRHAGNSRCTTQSTRLSLQRFPGLGHPGRRPPPAARPRPFPRRAERSRRSARRRPPLPGRGQGAASREGRGACSRPCPALGASRHARLGHVGEQTSHPPDDIPAGQLRLLDRKRE